MEDENLEKPELTNDIDDKNIDADTALDADTAIGGAADEFDFIDDTDADDADDADADSFDGADTADGAEADAPKNTKKRGRIAAALAPLTQDPRVLKYRYLGLCFLLPAFTMWLIYIALGTYPFGTGSVLVLDLNGQYVYYFEQLRNIVMGDGSFLYSFGRALGGEFMGIYAYYLASPFSFLVCLFPKSMITEALLCMFLLKTGLCGLTFGIYLHNHTEKRRLNKTAIVMFSTIYALTAYAIVQQHNTMWIDNLIMLPLITLGIERLIRYRRFRLLVISLTIAVMSNFYIGYMMCIYVFFYFFVAYGTIEPEERNMTGETRHFGKSLLRIGGCAALVLSMSCVILWSAYYSLTFGKTTFSNPDYTDFSAKFDLLDLISKLFIGSYDTVRPEGLPFVYCGTLVLLLLPLFFIIKSVRFREKARVTIMSAIFVLSFQNAFVDLVWHGFQRPNWLNYRYSFMLCFFMIFAAYRAFERLSEVETKTLACDGAFFVLLLIIIQKAGGYEWVGNYETVWLSFVFIAAFVILMRFHVTSKLRGGLSLAIASIVVLECFVSGLLDLISLDMDVVYSSRPSYRTFVDHAQPLVAMIEDGDDSFYRMEKTFHRKTNDSLALGFYGLSNSTSTLNKDTIAFLHDLGLSSKSHWSKYLGGTPVLDSLLGLKYIMIEEGSSISTLYEQAYSYDDGMEGRKPLLAYKNPYALPLAYGVDPSVRDYSTEDDSSPFDRMNAIVGRMLGETRADVFVPIRIEDTECRYCSSSYISGHHSYTNDSSEPKGRVIYTITAPQSGNIYCYFPSDYPRESDMFVNNVSVSTYYGNETNRVFDLGYFIAGETVKVELRMKEYDKLYIKSEDTYFYTIDEDEFVRTMTELSTSGFNIESYTEDSFRGTINIAEGDEFVFTTIPYDEGWVVKLDGERVELEKTIEVSAEFDPDSGKTDKSYALIGFHADPGSHELTLEYRPRCVVVGGIISLCGFCAFAAVCAVDFALRHGKKRRVRS